MNDGARTHDNRNHNPGLYQLSYVHHKMPSKKMARPAGLEPATPGLEGRCSIQMSYGRVLSGFKRGKPPSIKYGRGRGIRTPDILLPKQARYQTALCPVKNTLRLFDRAIKSRDDAALLRSCLSRMNKKRL